MRKGKGENRDSHRVQADKGSKWSPNHFQKAICAEPERCKSRFAPLPSQPELTICVIDVSQKRLLRDVSNENSTFRSVVGEMSGGGVIFQELVSGGGYRRGRATLTHAFETPTGVGGYIPYTYDIIKKTSSTPRQVPHQFCFCTLPGASGALLDALAHLQDVQDVPQ